MYIAELQGLLEATIYFLSLSLFLNRYYQARPLTDEG